MEITIKDLEYYQKIFKHKLAQKILLSLDDKGSNIQSLQKILNERRSNINREISRLEELGLIERTMGKKALTPLGKIVKIKFDEFIKLLLTINKNKSYWETHLINIPDKFLTYLYVFYEGKIIANTIDDDTNVLRNVKNKVVNGNSFYAVISGYSKNYKKIVENILKDNKKVEIIIKKELWSTIRKKEPKIEQEIKNYKNLKIYTSEDLDKFTMLFTDKNVFLFLFKKNGDIEWNECLYSENEESVFLARKIFEFYKEKSSEI